MSLNKVNESLLVHSHKVEEFCELLFLENEKLKRENLRIKESIDDLEILEHIQYLHDLIELYFEEKERYKLEKLSQEKLINKLYEVNGSSIIYSEMELMELEGEKPTLKIKISDLFISNVYIGQVGIDLIKSSDCVLIRRNNQIISPLEILRGDKAKRDKYNLINYHEWKFIVAGLVVLFDEFNILRFENKYKWRSVIENMYSHIRILPKQFRYERVSLESEVVNIDYESISLKYENCIFGAEFRKFFNLVVGIEIRENSNKLEYPKIEFPIKKNVKPIFENWDNKLFDGARDGYEIRFDCGNLVLDYKSWSLLSKRDQIKIFYVVDDLKRALENDQIKITKTNLEQWIEVLVKMKKILSINIKENLR